jgi:hypothetical protein
MSNLFPSNIFDRVRVFGRISTWTRGAKKHRNKIYKNALQINAVMGGELLGTAGQGRRY